MTTNNGRSCFHTVHGNANMDTCTYTCMYTYINTYTCTYTHAYTQTRAYAYARRIKQQAYYQRVLQHTMIALIGEYMYHLLACSQTFMQSDTVSLTNPSFASFADHTSASASSASSASTADASSRFFHKNSQRVSILGLGRSKAKKLVCAYTYICTRAGHTRVWVLGITRVRVKCQGACVCVVLSVFCFCEEMMQCISLVFAG